MARTGVPRPVLLTVVVAALITAGALVTAVALRPVAARTDGSAATATPRQDGCGGVPCRVLAATKVGRLTVELLADAEGASGRLRAGGPGSGKVADTAITAMGARLTQHSLRCVAAGEPVCLVRAPHDGGVVAEVQVWRGGAWRATGAPYFSDAGSVSLHDAAGDAKPEIVVVRHDCSGVDGVHACQQAPVVAEVFELSGARLGCTGTYGSPASLRGWPEVEVNAEELADCPEQ